MGKHTFLLAGENDNFGGSKKHQSIRKLISKQPKLQPKLVTMIRLHKLFMDRKDWKDSKTWRAAVFWYPASSSVTPEATRMLLTPPKSSESCELYINTTRLKCLHKLKGVLMFRGGEHWDDLKVSDPCIIGSVIPVLITATVQKLPPISPLWVCLLIWRKSRLALLSLRTESRGGV